ncbi:MAG: TonB family protein [Bacteroidales bacterium]|nr:TonB family protein [Bacteroidales bacterium]
MNSKNEKNVGLNNKRQTSFLIGYILVFGMIFVSLEWTQATVSMKTYTQSGVETTDEEVMPFTLQNPPPPPPPPTIARDVITLVDNDVDITEVKIQETESNEETKVDIRSFNPNETYGEGEYVDEEIPMIDIQVPPKFPGGDAALMQWLNRNIQYPKAAKNRGEKGRVTISFVIDKNGRVINGRIEKGVSAELDAEALRILTIMPDWEPGKQNNKPVKVRYILPVTFRLTTN